MSHYCFNCFHHMESGTTRCSKCGFDCAAYQKPAAAMRPETVLMGRYVIGKMVEQKSSTITYVAKDRQENKKVVVREYFPSAVAVRQADGTLAIRSHNDKQNFIDGMNAFIKETKSRKKLNDQPGHRSVIDSFNANNTVYRVLTYKKKKAADIPAPQPVQDQVPKYADMPFFEQKPVNYPAWEPDQEKTVNNRYTPPQEVKNIAADWKAPASSSKPNKKIFIIILAVVLAAAIAAGIYFFVIRKSTVTPLTVDTFKTKVEEKGYTLYKIEFDQAAYPNIQESVITFTGSSLDTSNWSVELDICNSDADAKETYDSFKENIDKSLKDNGITDQTEETISGHNYESITITYNNGGAFNCFVRVGNTVMVGTALNNHDSEVRDLIDACGYPLP